MRKTRIAVWIDDECLAWCITLMHNGHLWPATFCGVQSRRTSATGCHLHAPPDYSCNPQSNQHRQKEPRPSLTAAPPGDARKNQTECEVLRPIAESAYFAHKMERQPALPFLLLQLLQFFKL